VLFEDHLADHDLVIARNCSVPGLLVVSSKRTSESVCPTA
jgi:hypothetical protein